MQKILNFGSLNIDTVYSLDHIVRPGETISATGVEVFCGGKGFNQSIALARAGAKVFHGGKIGADGLFLAKALGDNGVNCDFLDCTAPQSGQAIIQKERSGENCIVLFGGANRQIDKAQIDTVLAKFSPGDLLITQNEISNLPYLLTKAAARGMEIIWNPSPMEPALGKIPLEQISWLVINAIEGAELSGKTDPQEILSTLTQRCPSLHILLTLGGQGACYGGPHGTFSQPAYPVTVVDTTAAGDTFLGYFIATFVESGNVPQALARASAASALAVMTLGALPSIPFAATVASFLAKEQP